MNATSDDIARAARPSRTDVVRFTESGNVEAATDFDLQDYEDNFEGFMIACVRECRCEPEHF